MRRVMPLTQGMPASPTMENSTEYISDLEYSNDLGLTKAQWDGLTDEEKRKIKEC